MSKLQQEYSDKFNEIPVGTRFRDSFTMWGLVKRSWCTAYYYDMGGAWKFVWPFERVQVITERHVPPMGYNNDSLTRAHS